jgi:hypothetical protein
MNAEELRRAVSELEATRRFPNREALWRALAGTPWARGRGLTAAALRCRARRLGVVPATPAAPHRLGPTSQGVAGRALRAAGGPSADFRGREPRTSPGRRGSKLVPLAVLRSQTPARFRRLVDRAEAGSVRAALRLKCLECSAWQPAEVRLCAVTACPLHHLRDGTP